MVWVSCDVPTAMRDMRVLPQFGFALRSVTLLDMFPGTWHMEVLLVWDRERT
jgi:23S rRNA (uracil1939-C5)-methyltransferase